MSFNYVAHGQAGGPKPHLQDKKLVSIRPTARTGRVEDRGGFLAPADLAMLIAQAFQREQIVRKIANDRRISSYINL